MGEVGLWIMGTDQNTGNPIWRGWYRKPHTENYDRKVEWAEAVERLAGMRVADRLKAAKELCGHKTPEIAQLGVEVLFGAYEPDAERAGVPAFLKGLPRNKAITASALVRADELFVNRDARLWVGSADRKALFDRFTEPLTEADAAEVAMHMLSATHRSDATITKADATAVLATIAGNPKQPAIVRGVTAEKLFAMTDLTRGPDPTFDLLVGVYKSAAEDAFRLQVARGFAALPRPPYPPYPGASYSPAQVEVLRGLVKDEKNAEVAKTLRATFDKVK